MSEKILLISDLFWSWGRLMCPYIMSRDKLTIWHAQYICGIPFTVTRFFKGHWEDEAVLKQHLGILNNPKFNDRTQAQWMIVSIPTAIFFISKWTSRTLYISLNPNSYTPFKNCLYLVPREGQCFSVMAPCEYWIHTGLEKVFWCTRGGQSLSITLWVLDPEHL